MPNVKKLALGLAAITGLWSSVAAAKTVVPDEAAPTAPSPPPQGGHVTASVEASNDGPVDVPAPSEKALRYHHGNNTIWATEQVLSIALPLLLLLTGLSAWLRTFASQLGRGRFYPTLAIYFVLLSLLLFLVELPLSYTIGFAREHAYGLSNQRFSKWANDQVKGVGVGVLVGLLVLWVPYLLLARSPHHWWLWTSALALPFYALTLLIAPLWIAPLFNKFGPMTDKVLESEVLAEAKRAGVEGARVF